MDQSPTNGGVAVDLQVQAQRATTAGLFRVNELPLWQFGEFDRDVMYVVAPKPNEYGQYCSNNGRFVLVTHEGDAWWGLSRCAKWVTELRRDFCAEYEITSGFVNVPASNGEVFLLEHLVARMADPFCSPPRGYTRAF